MSKNCFWDEACRSFWDSIKPLQNQSEKELKSEMEMFDELFGYVSSSVTKEEVDRLKNCFDTAEVDRSKLESIAQKEGLSSEQLKERILHDFLNGKLCYRN